MLSPGDEFAVYGKAGWDIGNLDLSSSKSPDMLVGEYARAALKRGLLLEKQLGVNPFQFGLIGSTDAHTALASAEEDNFYSKFTGDAPSTERADKVARGLGGGELVRYGWQYLAGGYAGVWAHENSREAIFDAFMRREVYATTGPRMAMRMFAGYGLSADDSERKPCALFIKNPCQWAANCRKATARLRSFW